jgi:hypothetical protein
MLGRAPGSAEVTGALALAVWGMAESVLDSSEYRMRVVRMAYQQYLHRDADAAGLALWTNALGTGATIEQFAATLLWLERILCQSWRRHEHRLSNALFQDVLARACRSFGTRGVRAVARLRHAARQRCAGNPQE